MSTTGMAIPPDPDGWRVPDTVPELIAEAAPGTYAAEEQRILADYDAATRTGGVDAAAGVEARAAYAAHLDAPQAEPASTREPATGSADVPGAAAADESAASTHERSLEPVAAHGPVVGEPVGESLPDESVVDEPAQREVGARSAQWLTAARLKAEATNRRVIGTLYAVLAGLALYGQTQGLVDKLSLHRWDLGLVTVPAWPPAVVVALTIELVGVALLSTADIRRVFHQERALAGRVFAFAVALLVALINFAGHMGNGYRQALFAGASLVAFGVYLWRGACRRRDALIASGDMAAPAPLYPLSCYLPGRWKVTRLARELARRNRRLGMYGSLAAAETQLARQRRHAALMAAIRARIAGHVDPVTAEIAISTYDLDAIATRLGGWADNAGMAALLAADLTPDRLTVEPAQSAIRQRRESAQVRHKSRIGEPGEPRARHEAARSRRGEPAPARRVSRRTVSESVDSPVTGSPGSDSPTDDARIAEAYAALYAELDREPSGSELARRSGASKATANRWKQRRADAAASEAEKQQP